MQSCIDFFKHILSFLFIADTELAVEFDLTNGGIHIIGVMQYFLYAYVLFNSPTAIENISIIINFWDLLERLYVESKCKFT